MICGTINPDADHFSRVGGNVCPRFGTPDDENALFGVDVAEGEERPEDEEDEEDEEDPEEEDEDETAIQRVRAIEEEEAEALHQQWEMYIHRRKIVLAPLSPYHALIDPHPASVREQTAIMEEDRETIQSIANRGQEMVEDFLENILTRDHLSAEAKTALATRLEDTASMLAVNLDLYVHLDRIRGAYTEYSERHEATMDFITTVSRVTSSTSGRRCIASLCYIRSWHRTGWQQRHRRTKTRVQQDDEEFA